MTSPQAATAVEAAHATAAGRRWLVRFAWLSIAAAVVTITMKVVAWSLTGSVGLLSDAAESLVNLIAAIVALIALTVAARPPDDNHMYGHTKAEYFSAAVEGTMIFVAAIVIVVAAVDRILHPKPLESLGLGLLISVGASAVNGVVAVVLLRVGRAHRSKTLVADGQHLMTDVITSVGVLAGVALVWLTGWNVLDPIVALLVGLNIVVTGFKLVAESVSGLMDHVMAPDDHERIVAVLQPFRTADVDIHGLRTRESGYEQFIDFHVLVPGDWSVRQGHDLLEEIESHLGEQFPAAHISTHLEPREDPRSYNDYITEVPLDRPNDDNSDRTRAGDGAPGLAETAARDTLASESRDG